MMNTRSAPALLSLALMLAPTVAFAQQSQAAKLFDQAAEEFDEQNYAAACPHFEASLRLEPDGGTLFSLAQCLDKQGKALEALHRYEQFKDYFLTLTTAQKTKYMNTLKEATDRIEALKRLLPRLKLEMPENVPEGTEVLLDGKEIPTAKLNQVRWLEPGVHKLTVTVPGREPKEWPVELEPRQPLEELVRIPEAPPPTPQTPKAVPVKPKPVVVPSVSSAGWTGREVVMVAGGSIFLTGAIMGSIPFGMAKSRTSGVEAHCPNNKCDTPEWVQQSQNVKDLAQHATIGAAFAGAGAALLVGGLIAGAASKTPKPRVEATVLQFDTSGATFGLKGAF